MATDPGTRPTASPAPARQSLAGYATLRPDLMTFVDGLRTAASASCPDRTAELIAVRIVQLVRGVSPEMGHTDPEVVRQWASSSAFTAAERSLLGLVEQFVIDVHGVSDEQFAELRQHYSDRQIMALLYHAALCDGFAKLDAVWPQEEQRHVH